MHSDRADFEARAGNLAIEMQSDAFVGLKAKRQGVRVKVVAALGSEEDVRRRPELNTNFARAGGEVFARAQIERDAGPTPIIYEELERDVGFNIGIRLHLRFLAITRPLFA